MGGCTPGHPCDHRLHLELGQALQRYGGEMCAQTRRLKLGPTGQQGQEPGCWLLLHQQAVLDPQRRRTYDLCTTWTRRDLPIPASHSAPQCGPGRPVPAPSGLQATTEVHPFGVGKSTVRAQQHHLYAIGRCSDGERLQSHGRFS